MAKRNEDSDNLFTYEANEVDEVIASLPGKENKISLYRLNPQGKSAFICSFFPEEFSQDWIKENYGGGKFSIVAETSDGPKKMRFDVEGEPKIKGLNRMINQHVNGKHFLVSVPEKDLIERGIKEYEKIDIEKSANGIPQSNDITTTLLLGQIQRLESRIESWQNANPANNQRLEFYKEIAAIKEMFAPPPNPTGIAINEITAALRQGLELGTKAANGEINQPSIWESLIEKALPMISNVLQNVQARSTIPPALTNPLQNGADKKELPDNSFAAILPSSMNESSKMDLPGSAKGPAFIERIRPYLHFLVANAATGAAPDPWAEIILNQIPANEMPEMLTWLDSETWLADLINIDNRITLQQAWFVELRDSILETYKGNGEQEDGKIEG